MAFRAVAAAVALLVTAVSAAAQDFCADPMTRPEFDRLLRTSAERATVAWPGGVFPLGHPMDIALSTPEETNLVYRVFAAQPDVAASPVEIDVAHVSRDSASNVTNLRLFLDLDIENAFGNPDPNRAAAAEHRPLFLARMSFVVIGCEAGVSPDFPDVSGEELDRLIGNGLLPQDLKVFATTDRTVSTVWMGIASATLAFIVAVGVAWFAASSLGKMRDARANREGGTTGVRGLKALFVDFRNRVSLSHFQIFIFFTVVFVAVAYVFGRTRELSDLSEDVLLLLGISAVGGVAGKLADVRKNRMSWDNWTWLNFDLGAFDKKEEAKPSWWQLVSTQGEFDIYRFQALAFTLLVAPAFVIMSLYTLGEANIPPGILAVLGLSQATYIGGKLAVQPTLEEFDKEVGRMRERWSKDTDRIPRWEADKFAKEFEVALDMKPSDRLIARLVEGAPKEERREPAPAPGTPGNGGS